MLQSVRYRGFRIPLRTVSFCSPHRFLNHSNIRLRPLLGPAIVRFYSNPAELESKGPWVYSDHMSPTSCHKLDAALESHIPLLATHPLVADRHIGEEVPPGYHLIYFNSASAENKLAPDGYDAFQAPSAARFPFRMWAGGSVEYNPDKKLVLGQESYCVETLADYQHKTGEKERVVVTLERCLANGQYEEEGKAYLDNWAIKETRKLVYFTKDSAPKRDDSAEKNISNDSSRWPLLSHVVNPTTILLFRYSALTFNSHLIHYDKVYSQQVEHLPTILVQGPLMVTLLERWLDELVIPQLTPGKRIKKLTYKNLIPLFVDQTMTLACGEVKEDRELKVWIENCKGSSVLTGTLELY